MNTTVKLDYSKTVLLPFKVGNTYDLPLIATNDFNCTAISLILYYYPEYMKINSVTLPDGTPVDFNTGNPRYPTYKLRINWVPSGTTQFMEMKTDQTFMFINIEVMKDFAVAQTLELTMIDDPTVKFADDTLEVIPMVTIKTEILKQYEIKKLTVAETKLAQEYVTKPITQTCSNCENLNGTRCGIGGFIVGKTAKCLNYISKI